MQEDFNFDKNINSSLNDEFIHNEIKTKGISLRVGNKIVKFAHLEDELITLEDEIVKDYHKAYQQKIDFLNTELKQQSDEYKFMYDKKMKEINNLKHELSEQLRNSNLMPDITYEHFQQGLSITKNHPDYSGPNIVWAYQGNYHVKYLNRDRIDPAYSIKKLNKPVIIEIVSSGFNILSVKVLNIDKTKFIHYHSFSHGADCWGNWLYGSIEAKTPDDIITIAKKSLDVLSVLNEMSIANRTPRGLPRLPTIRKNLLTAETPTNNAQEQTEQETPLRPRRPRQTIWNTDNF